jgi:hypothetical protein
MLNRYSHFDEGITGLICMEEKAQERRHLSAIFLVK